MLTGDEEITSGNAYLSGIDIKSSLKEVCLISIYSIYKAEVIF
jgi:hypothetical protein